MRLPLLAASFLLLSMPGNTPGPVSYAAPAQNPFAQNPQGQGLSAPVTPGHAFYFTRAAYGGGRRGRGFGSWATDWPKADQQFVVVLKRLTLIDSYDLDNAIRFDDPRLRRYPVVYAVEVGGMLLAETEVKALREYLLAGGLLIADDFWGPREFAQFESQMQRVLPEYRIVDLPEDHPIRRNVYRIDQVLSVPNIYRGRMGLDPAECDECRPGRLMGISDDQGRLLVLISFNSDLGDAWEWAEQPDYPLPYSNYAFRLGVNWVVFGMTN